MTRRPSGPAEDQSHGFDQTNGLVDLGDEKKAPSDGADERRRVAQGMAVLNTQKLSGI